MFADMVAIAERVGVSRATVYRALTNTGRISEETRRKVLQAARELDYRPNDLARALRAQKSATVGYSACTLGFFQAQVILGAEHAATLNGYDLLVTCCLLDPVREIQHIDMLREKRVDGIIVSPAQPETNAKYFRELLDTGPPFVFVDSYMPGIDASCVVTDNYTGGLLAGRHLASLGRKKMVFVNTAGNDRLASSVTERLRGFEAALAEAGLSVLALLGGEGPGNRASMTVAEYIQGGGELDAVFAVNDTIAASVMCALHNAGIRVPEDVSVVGFDGLDVSYMTWPSLTTVRQPVIQMGMEAMRLLLDIMAADAGTRRPVRIVLTPELIIGGSCGAKQDCSPELPDGVVRLCQPQA